MKTKILNALRKSDGYVSGQALCNMLGVSRTAVWKVINQLKEEGIDKKDLPHIFKRFYKGKSNSKEDSVGIGLAMAKSIIESQNGDIYVKSEKNKGTEFHIVIHKTYSD